MNSKHSHRTVPLIKIKIPKFGDEIIALADSGAARSFIHLKLFLKLIEKLKITAKPYKLKCVTANSSELNIFHSTTLKIVIQGLSWKFNFLISDQIPYKIILGYDFFVFLPAYFRCTC